MEGFSNDYINAFANIGDLKASLAKEKTCGIKAQKFFTKRLGRQLCQDLGIKWEKWCQQPLSEYLLEIKRQVDNSQTMPKIRHRHKFLCFGVDKSSKTDGRWLWDFIDDDRKVKLAEKKWSEMGVMITHESCL